MLEHEPSLAGREDFSVFFLLFRSSPTRRGVPQFLITVQVRRLCLASAGHYAAPDSSLDSASPRDLECENRQTFLSAPLTID